MGEHNNYVIFTEPNAGLLMHFIHSDSLLSLGLTPAHSVNASNGSSTCQNSSRKLFSAGEVIDKEYCQAKKAENRFRVPQGTKFYRVKCKNYDRSSSTQASSESLVSSLAQSQPL